MVYTDDVRLQRPSSPKPSGWRILLSTLCMALVVFAGTVAVAHNHQHAVDHAVDEHGTCGLCVTAHAVAQVASAPTQVILVQSFEDIVPEAPVARTRTFTGSSHDTRPPPVGALSL